MEDYPRTLLEMERRFATEEACRSYLAALRWPGGFVCPGCGGQRAWTMGRGLWLCSACRRQTSVRAGTIFQDSRLPLTRWFRAMWYVTSQKNGVSALGLQRILGLGSYQTAWAWLQKLRRAMVRPGRDRLSGRVEVDETYWGGEEEGVLGRLPYAKALILVAAQQEEAGIGRIRMACVPDLTKASLHGFIRQTVEAGRTVVTAGLNAYGGLAGYVHQPMVIRRQAASASELLPRVHRVVSLLKRWLMGTHQGAVRSDHLAYYLDEFTFRFNRRTSASRGKLFYRLMQQAALVQPRPYKTLIHPKG
ncbi:MAG: IS1595 family transposase [candidate division NC10 bacterium]|nr:IS1595 family transposase [candidate division NC10 bacterium]